MLQYLEESTKNYPQKKALFCETGHLTYQELSELAQKIGSYLSTKSGGMVNKPIAVFIDRDIQSIAIFLGILYSGNYYAPIDSSIPIARVNTILDVIKPNLIITNNKLNLEINFESEILSYAQLINSDVDSVLIEKIRSRSIDTDPVYSIFTSGSTGVPKGVLICHRSIIDFIEHFSKIFNLSANCIFGNQAPFDFDVSVKDIYSTIRNGASMYVIPKSLFSFPVKLIEYLNDKRVNTIVWATSAMRIIANFRTFEHVQPRHLKAIMFSGEVMPNKILNYWRRYLPEVCYVNLYGPTEITCNCSYYIVDRNFEDFEMLPIGKPFPNTEILLLSEDNRRVEQGTVGEICVRGSSLALGYYNNQIQTSAAFIQNPVNFNYPELIYKTGDIGKLNSNGELLYLSRKDSQIKHLGHRIELGEIEIAVNSLAFIEVASCDYDIDKDLILLFYQSDRDRHIEIINGISLILPKYMVPNKLYFLKKIPINKNLKIDRPLLHTLYKNGQLK